MLVIHESYSRLSLTHTESQGFVMGRVPSMRLEFTDCRFPANDSGHGQVPGELGCKFSSFHLISQKLQLTFYVPRQSTHGSIGTLRRFFQQPFDKHSMRVARSTPP